MRTAKKVDFPVAEARRYLEPGPTVLVSSSWRGQRNIMTLGWQTVLEFSPSRVGCMISSGNHSFAMIRDSGECVINVPSSEWLDTVVDIGNCSGREVDKFAHFGLHAETAQCVKAPLIAECFANFECRLVDDRLVADDSFFVFEIVKAHVAESPKHPQTVHYLGNGEFMLSGNTVSRRRRFRDDML